MKSKTLLQYLSTASDSFLVVAFAVLVALPFALSLAIQPIAKNISNSASALNSNYVASRPNTANTNNAPTKVLGVSDFQPTSTILPTLQIVNPSQNVSVTFATSQDAKKLSIDGSSSSGTQYSINGNIKQAGSYNVFTFTNNNSTSINLNTHLIITDNRTLTVSVAGQSYKLSKDNSTPPLTVLGPNSQTIISISSDNKNLGGFSLKVELKS